MTSIKIHYRPSQKAGAQEGKLFFRIIHRRRSRSVTTDYALRSEEWDAVAETVILPTNDPVRYDDLSDIAGKLFEDRQRLESLISEYSLRGEYDVDDLVDSFKRKQLGGPAVLSVYCEKVCKELEAAGQERTARAYRSAVRSFQQFAPQRLLFLSDINLRTIKAYEEYLLEKGLYLNTVSFYMRQLRAIYYRAVKEKAVRRREDNPFGEVFTGVHKTRHRALTEAELNTLASLEITLDKRIGTLTREAAVRQAKAPDLAATGSGAAAEMNSPAGCRETDGTDSDVKAELDFYLKLKRSLLIFLFCFHARGMSYVDMAYLKKSDVGSNTIIYKRKKTGRFLEVGITKPMREIMEWFAADVNDSPYVFPIIDPANGRERTQYECGLRRQNQLLGLLTKMAGLDKKVTTHVSRHTWATVAKWRKVPVAVISEALGHRDMKTTEHYLASFEQSVLDKLSKEISGVIKKGKKAA